MLWLGVFGKLAAIKTDTATIIANQGAGAYAMLGSTSAPFVTGTAYATLVWSTNVLQGFTFASNALTCTAPGVYDIVLNFSVTTTANGGFIAYRLNGGAEVPIYFDASTASFKNQEVHVRLKLAVSDTLDFRMKANGAGDTIQLAGSLVQASLVRVST